MTEMRSGLPIIAFEDAAAFGSWLGGKGATETGLWVRLAKKGAPEPTLSKSEAIDVALCYGWIDGQLDRYDEHYWLIRFTPRKPRSKWSEINRKRASELIKAGWMKPAGMAQVMAAKEDWRWDAAYAPQSSIRVPHDFAAALDCSKRAKEFFDTLAGANRYAILYRIGAVKRAETRRRKIAQFIEMLERHETIHG